MESKKIDTSELICKTEVDSQTQKKTYGYQWGNFGEETNQEFRIKIYTLIYKIDN